MTKFIGHIVSFGGSIKHYKKLFVIKDEKASNGIFGLREYFDRNTLFSPDEIPKRVNIIVDSRVMLFEKDTVFTVLGIRVPKTGLDMLFC